MRGLIVAALSLALAACHARPVPAQTGGDAAHGETLVTEVGCGSCHQIPGVSGANGLVGPPLIHMGSRTVIAGVLPNTPPNMVAWLEHPQAIVPGNAMPETGLSEQDARDITAYLATLH